MTPYRSDLAPGAVAIVGHDGKIVYRKAYGIRSSPRADDAGHDLRSGVADQGDCHHGRVMQLFEQGKIKLQIR